MKKELVTSARTRGPRGAGRRPPFLLELVLSNRCNLDCGYCSSSFLLHGKERRAFSPGELRRAVDLYREALRANGMKGEGLISFTGNEPLLEFPLLKETVSYVRKAYPELRMRLDTNGVLLDREKAGFLAANGVRIFVSLDGCREAHDRHRFFRGGRGSFGAVVRALKRLPPELREGGGLCVWSVTTPGTVGLLPRSLKFFRRLGVGTVVLGLETYSGWDARALRGLRAAFRIFRSRPLEALGGCPPPRFLFGLSGAADFRGIIGQAVSLAFDGRFYPCDFALIPPGGPELSVGDLKNGIDMRRLDRIVSLPMFRAITRDCAHMSGLRAPVERYYWGLARGLGEARLAKEMADTARVNRIFREDMSGYLRLQETGERLSTEPGFGDLVHSPRYAADKPANVYRLRLAGGGLSGPRARLDFFLCSAGTPKSLTLEALVRDGDALRAAADLSAYALAKAGLLGIKLSVSLEAV
ncbi:MAG: radical SAM protein [Elusimicrobiales bacterium]|nr:radical SAM protein [Elusimicrobiales bacterium]